MSSPVFPGLLEVSSPDAYAPRFGLMLLLEVVLRVPDEGDRPARANHRPAQVDFAHTADRDHPTVSIRIAAPAAPDLQKENSLARSLLQLRKLCSSIQFQKEDT